MCGLATVTTLSLTLGIRSTNVIITDKEEAQAWGLTFEVAKAFNPEIVFVILDKGKGELFVQAGTTMAHSQKVSNS